MIMITYSTSVTLIITYLTVKPVYPMRNRSYNKPTDAEMWLILLYFILVPVCCVLVLRFLNKPYNPPLFGVYQQKNKTYWLKFVFMYTLLRVRQLITRLKRAYAVESGKSCDGTIEVHREDEALEQKFYIGDYPHGVDAVYFNGVSNDGAAIICGFARRPQHVCDAFLYIKLHGEELLLSPNLPDTYHQQNASEAGDYKIQGLQIANFIPMRTWKIVYSGNMKLRNSSETVKVRVDFTWSAIWPPFNYDFQMSPRSMAQDMAREPWSRDYFNRLKKIHQTHYEQMGSVKGTVTINEKEHYVRIPCVRDHSFGKFRDWSTFHRYVLHFIFLDNGDCMAVGTVSQPDVLSHLTIGYLCLKTDQTVVPVDQCDFHLYQHGENQVMPKDYGFTFRADRKQHTVRVQVDDEEIFYIGKTRGAKFYERWCSVEVNGVKGRACVEWHYNNIKKSE